MPRPRLDRSSDAGNSLVGTLLGLGVLLAMVTAGIALMASTQGRPEPVADIRMAPIAFAPCPASVADPSAHAATVRCARVPVLNTGQAAGLARCMLFDGTRGTATFELTGTHVDSFDLAPGATQALLVRIDDDKDPTLPVVQCGAAPLPVD